MTPADARTMLLAMRNYSDREVQRIIGRALELQKDQAGILTDRVTIEQVEEIGEQLGISPEHIRRAAEELSAIRLSTARGMLGAPVSRVLAQTVPSQGPLPDVEELGTAMPVLSGDSGIASVLNRNLTWITDETTYQTKGRQTRVEVLPREGAISVKITESLAPIAGGLFGGIVGGLGVGGGLAVGLGVGLTHGMPLFALAVPALALASTYLLARFVYRVVFNARSTRLRKLMDTLLGQLRAPRDQE